MCVYLKVRQTKTLVIVQNRDKPYLQIEPHYLKCGYQVRTLQRREGCSMARWTRILNSLLVYESEDSEWKLSIA